MFDERDNINANASDYAFIYVQILIENYIFTN